MRPRTAHVVPVVEQERVPLPAIFDTPKVKQRLCRAAERAGMADAFILRRGQLYAGNVVGVVDIGPLAVEILPKVWKNTSPEQGKAFLADLLRYIGRDTTPMASSMAHIREGQGGLMEAILAWAARQVSRFVQEGVPRRYVQITEKSIAVRGKIDMTRLAMARPERLFELTVTHAPLSIDNPVSQAIRWLALLLGRLTRSSSTRAIASRTMADLSGVRDVDIDEHHLDKIQLSPLEEHWAPIIAFTRSLVRQRSLDPTRSGGIASIAILFTVYDLFEAALRRAFRDHGATTGLLLGGRMPSHLLVGKNGEGGLVRLRPDYTFRLAEVVGKECLAVGDAKWKLDWSATGRPKPKRQDAHQLAAYMAASQAKVGFLFMPVEISEGEEPTRSHRLFMAGTGAEVHIIGVHMPSMVNPGVSSRAVRHKLCADVAAALRETTISSVS